jgi:lipopolysaccharide transport system permease protein
VLWLYFANAVNAATESLAGHRELVTKVYFPRLIAPLAAVLPGLLDLGVALMPVAVFMAIFGVVPSAAIALLPLWVLATVVFAFGVGTWLAALNVKYRDVKNAISFLLQLWFFATPVVYGSSLLSGKWSFLVAINPMAGLINGFRWSLVGEPTPDGTTVVALAVGALVVIGGIAYFARVERFFADLI